MHILINRNVCIYADQVVKDSATFVPLHMHTQIKNKVKEIHLFVRSCLF